MTCVYCLFGLFVFTNFKNLKCRSDWICSPPALPKKFDWLFIYLSNQVKVNTKAAQSAQSTELLLLLLCLVHSLNNSGTHTQRFTDFCVWVSIFLVTLWILQHHILFIVEQAPTLSDSYAKDNIFISNCCFVYLPSAVQTKYGDFRIPTHQKVLRRVDMNCDQVLLTYCHI